MPSPQSWAMAQQLGKKQLFFFFFWWGFWFSVVLMLFLGPRISDAFMEIWCFVKSLATCSLGGGLGWPQIRRPKTHGAFGACSEAAKQLGEAGGVDVEIRNMRIMRFFMLGRLGVLFFWRQVHLRTCDVGISFLSKKYGWSWWTLLCAKAQRKRGKRGVELLLRCARLVWTFPYASHSESFGTLPVGSWNSWLLGLQKNLCFWGEINKLELVEV